MIIIFFYFNHQRTNILSIIYSLWDQPICEHRDKLELADSAVVAAGSTYSPAVLLCCLLALYCPSPALTKAGSYRQLVYHSFWLAGLPNSCRVKLTREPMSKVETNRAMDWCLKNCVTRGEPIKTLFSSSNVLLACYKGFPWWKRRVELQPQIPPQRLQKWEEFAQCLCYFLIEFCSWNQL